jgi:hypothetical protein
LGTFLGGDISKNIEVWGLNLVCQVLEMMKLRNQLQLFIFIIFRVGPWGLVEIIPYFSGLFNLFLIDILRILSKLPYWWGHWNSSGDLFPGLHFPFRQLKTCQSVLIFQD